MKLKTLLIAGTALAAAVAAAAIVLRKPTPRPNIVLVVIDTLRADRLSFYGYPKETAPFLSSLASQGVVFEKAYSASSWTAPGTASIFTGLYPLQHSVVMGLHAQKKLIHNHPHIRIRRIPEEVTTLPELLRRGGYRTFGFSDNANISRHLGFDQGFDILMSGSHKGGKAINRRVLDLEKQILSGGPYFLYLHYNDVHLPYKIPLDESQETGDWLADMKMMYDLEIAFVDSCLKELSTKFDWSKNTLLIVTSDHGEEQYEKEYYGHGKSLYNTVIRVPLLIFWPEKELFSMKRPTVNVSTMDILPTLASLLGLDKPKGLAGEDLKPVLEGRARSGGERYIYSHLQHKAGTSREKEQKCCILGDKKYIFVRPKDHIFFDLKLDPEEQINRYAEELQAASALAKNLFAFENSCPRFNSDYVDIQLDKEAIENLRALGYVR